MNSYGTIQIHLDKLMKDRQISQTKLIHRAELQWSQVARYRKNEAYRLDMDILARMCAVLDCKIGELLEYVPCRQANP